MKKTKIIRAILIILIVIWAILIFGLSNQDGSESSGLSKKLVAFFIKDSNLAEIVEGYVRKVAHFSEYGLGGILFISLFSTYDWSERRRIITSVLLGTWYAGIDELHQLLVDGRNGSIADVWIDSLGVMTGVTRNAYINKNIWYYKK